MASFIDCVKNKFENKFVNDLFIIILFKFWFDAMLDLLGSKFILRILQFDGSVIFKDCSDDVVAK